MAAATGATEVQATGVGGATPTAPTKVKEVRAPQPNVHALSHPGSDPVGAREPQAPAGSARDFWRPSAAPLGPALRPSGAVWQHLYVLPRLVHLRATSCCSSNETRHVPSLARFDSTL